MLHGVQLEGPARQHCTPRVGFRGHCYIFILVTPRGAAGDGFTVVWRIACRNTLSGRGRAIRYDFLFDFLFIHLFLIRVPGGYDHPRTSSYALYDGFCEVGLSVIFHDVLTRDQKRPKDDVVDHIITIIRTQWRTERWALMKELHSSPLKLWNIIPTGLSLTKEWKLCFYFLFETI